MNWKLLCKVLGLIVFLLAGTMLLCEIYALSSEDAGGGAGHDFALLKSFVMAAALGGLLLAAGRGGGDQILRKEAIAIVGLGWLVSALTGAIPYVLCATPLGPVDAIFESASGFTTTGATVITNLDLMPRSILLWRSTTQWLGGMGILVLFVALLSNFGAAGKSLLRHESSAKSGYGFHSRIRQTALRLWQIYIVLTALCIFGLMILGMSFYDAVLHAFSAISTGGFSPQNASIAAYQSAAIDAWLCVFMALGGTSFLLMAWILRGGHARVRADEELRAYVGILAAASLVLTWNLVVSGVYDFGQALRFATFQVISIMTTTGFATADFGVWPPFAQALLVILMFVGGCAGSTSGGIKVNRIVILCKAAAQQTIVSFRPNHHIPVKLNGEPLDSAAVVRALFFVALSGMVVGISCVFLALLEPGSSLTGTFTAVVASLFNIGPGLAEVGPTQNFAFFGPDSKIFLAALMILGRLEFFGLLALMVPALWKKY
jgi:trk system potassium uptake protein